MDDVDLFIAAISETPVAGGLLGPTFQVRTHQILLNFTPILLIFDREHRSRGPRNRFDGGELFRS